MRGSDVAIGNLLTRNFRSAGAGVKKGARKKGGRCYRPPVREQERTRFRAPTAVRFRESRLSRADRPARKPWVLGARCLARRAKNIAFRTVRAYRLARDREGFRLAVRSGGDGLGASSAPWGASSRAVLLRCAFTRCRSPPGDALSNAGRDGRRSLVTGPVDWPPVAFAAPDRSIGASLLRFRSHPFDVRWPRRAVRGLPASGPSRFGV